MSSEENYINELIDNLDIQMEFKNYKIDCGEKYSIEDVSSFSIANNADVSPFNDIILYLCSKT